MVNISFRLKRENIQVWLAADILQYFHEENVKWKFSCVPAYDLQYDDLLDRVGIHIKNKESVFTL